MSIYKGKILIAGSLPAPTGAMTYKGTCLQANLPTSGQRLGDYWKLSDALPSIYYGQCAVWNSLSWDYSSSSFNVDDELSLTSNNAIANKVVTAELNNKVDKEVGKGLFSGSYNDLRDKPETNFLALDGGTMRGSITSTVEPIIKKQDITSRLQISGGNGGYTTGSTIELYGSEHATHAGAFAINAYNATSGLKQLLGKPDGTLSWNGKDIVTMETIQGLLQVLYDGIYPINSIVFGFQVPHTPTGVIATWTDVSSSYNGRWLKVDSGVAGGTAQAESISIVKHTLTINELPAHTHTRGTMNITGSVGDFFCQNNMTTSGAFTHTRTLTFNYSGGANGIYFEKIGLNAANTGAWTGETSSVGGGQGHSHTANSIKPLTTTIKVYKRTA